MSFKSIGKVINFADEETMELLSLWKEAVSEIELDKHVQASSYIFEEYTHYIVVHDPLDMEFSQKRDEWNKRFSREIGVSVVKLVKHTSNKLYFKGLLATNNSAVYGIAPYTEFDHPEASFPIQGMDKLKRTVFSEVIPLIRGSNILDVGCGLGAASMEIAKQHPSASVLGIDIQKGMIRQCRLNADIYNIDNVRFEATSVYKLPYESNKFDTVTCFFMLHHLDDIPRALEEIKRVLADGGKVLAAEPLDHHHGTKREGSDWIKLFEEAGFSADSINISKAAFIEAKVAK
ncbi:class I SAM-dependent methyltransferase [Methanolobus halotolerans]|uniref:Ubiquinone biosynthesis protein UbiE n=1 Tax=Methanolobus halotolerans TaxID=2052935 RepID=A0A4E0Q358_9EURY|nr:class I SAM-dependent methyltransferase [Methanolobus halotolerans]TGC07451.1 ubiquinone biosynthesis protein UbiE [Methanolobus halotolerans]